MNNIQFYFSPDGTDGGSDNSVAEPQEATDNTEKPTEAKSEADAFYSDSKEENVEGQDEESKDEGEKVEEEQANDDGEESKDEGTEKDKVDDFGFEKFEVEEGFEVTDKAKELFKKHELSQEASQELVNYGIEIQKDTLNLLAEEQTKQQEAWAAETKEKYGKELPELNQFVEKHAPEGFAEFLTESGLWAHPKMAEFVSTIKNSISEDAFDKAPATPTEKPPVTGEQALYGNKYDNIV